MIINEFVSVNKTCEFGTYFSDTLLAMTICVLFSFELDFHVDLNFYFYVLKAGTLENNYLFPIYLVHIVPCQSSKRDRKVDFVRSR